MNTNKNIITQKDLIHIFTLTTPKPNDKKSGFKSSIASTVILEDKEDLRISKNFFPVMYRLGLRKMALLIISDDIEKTDIITYKETFRDTIECSISIIELNTKEFFSLKGFERFIEKNSYEIVYAVKGKTWQEICALFISILFDISGGSNAKKHLFAPHQQRLSQFLSCLFSSDASLKVNESFHELSKKDISKRADYTPKEVHEGILKMITTDEYIKSRVFKDFYLSNFIHKDYIQATSEHKLQKIENSSNIDDTNLSPNSSNTADSSNLSSISKVSKSKFHTSATQFNFKKNQSFPIIQAPKAINMKEKSIIFLYLDSMKELVSKSINTDELQRQNIQEKFENSWIEYIEEKMKNEQFLLNRNQSHLFSYILDAEQTLKIMSEENYLKKKFPQLNTKLNKIDYIILTYSLCITLYSRLSYNSLVKKVGDEILYLYYKKEYLSKTIDTKDSFMTYNNYKSSLNLDSSYIIKLGDFFISLLVQFPHDLFIRNIKLNSFYTHDPYTLEINKTYLDEIKNNLIINPNTLPMLCKPKEWSDNSYGGFITNEDRGIDIITGIETFKHKIEKKNPIYTAVNYLNSIKFSVNNSLFNYLNSSEGNYLLESIKPNDELQRILTLKVAEFFKDIYFYLPTHADWRGRIYAQSFYLNYQGGDLSTALLNFWEGEAITEEGKYYLYIYGANSHNEKSIRKASYEDRLNWVKDNYNKIINLDKDLILSAESPFTFAAFCLNMKELHNNPTAIIKTPVFLDATCSGIQHLAALMKDLELGSQVNFLPSKESDIPADIYNSLLDIINSAINEFGKNNPEYYSLELVELSRKEIKRAVMTKVYNVTTYGISQQLKGLFKIVSNTIKNNSIINNSKWSKTNKIENNLDEFNHNFIDKPIEKLEKSIKEELKSNNDKTEYFCPGKWGMTLRLTDKDIYKIASIINDQIFVIYPSLNYIYNYFINISKLTISLGLPLTWITPSGIKITQLYLKKRKKVVTVSIFGKARKMVFKENTELLDRAKQSQAIIPNIIHSLDASHLIRLIKTASYDNFYPIITIHDCFGTLPNKMGELEHRVKKEFVILYSDNIFLNDFHQRFIQNIKDNNFEIININNDKYVIIDQFNKFQIPNKPQLGKLDLENIMKSKYMIC